MLCKAFFAQLTTVPDCVTDQEYRVWGGVGEWTECSRATSHSPTCHAQTLAALLLQAIDTWVGRVESIVLHVPKVIVGE